MAQQVELLRILSMEHEEVGSLLSMLATADAEQRKVQLPVLRQQLLAHAKAEEKTLYAAIVDAGAQAVRSQIEEATHEHAAMAATLARLAALDVEDDAWDEALQTLTELVQEHVVEEERDVFDMARRALGDDALESLAQTYQEQRRQELVALGATAQGKAQGQ
jgi:iron-sulfur cluster repair protein YtfE (RIC family)